MFIGSTTFGYNLGTICTTAQQSDIQKFELTSKMRDLKTYLTATNTPLRLVTQMRKQFKFYYKMRGVLEDGIRSRQLQASWDEIMDFGDFKVLRAKLPSLLSASFDAQLVISLLQVCDPQSCARALT
jgi:hypothetical protein